MKQPRVIAGMKVHPAANLFPLMEGEAFAELVADVKANGLREPITLYQGKILDGRNRARACVKARAKPKTRVWKGSDPMAYVVSLNLARRHLTESQRAMVAARLVDTSHGGDRRSSGRSAGRTQEQAAAELTASPRSVRQAARVIRDADPELAAAVDAGHVAVSLAEKLVGRPVREQRKVARESAQGAQPSKIVRELHRQDRQRKMAGISKGNRRLKMPERFGVILADPSWLYNEGTTTPDRRIDNHYPPMTLAEICKLPVRELGLDDSILFLWIPSPLILEAAPPVLEAWGYDYKSQWIWNKVGKRKRNGEIGGYRGTGHWAIVEHEHVLICPRGDVPTPATNARFRSVFDAPVGKHSEKPPEVHRRIEAMYPKATKIELFAREARKGWKVWGNQAK
jgi:N6-adenosine-specific RNA methylase IME4